MSPRKVKTDPEIINLPSQKMAIVTAKGAPDKVFAKIFPALYGSVYSLKFGLKKKGLPDFKVGCPRARYPDIITSPKEEWTIITGIPVPEDTVSLPQKNPEITVKLDTWQYGPSAQILHLGPYAQEDSSIKRLQQFISDSGYEITGDHEEEYQSRPEAKVMKTIIRYPVKLKEN